MKNIILLLVLTSSLLCFNRKNEQSVYHPIIPSATYDIYYTYTVPYAVRQAIIDAMDEVSPRQYISSNTVPIFGSLLPDPLNATILNPDTVLTSTGPLPIPDIYTDNGHINIHWGIYSAPGCCDPFSDTPYFDIVIDSLQYGQQSLDLKTILKHEILHGIGAGHTSATFDGNPASDKIMYEGISPGGPEKFMSQDEVNCLNEMYNKAYYVKPTPEQTEEYIYAVRKDSIDFCTKRDISLTTLFNTAGDSLNPYSIKYRWQYGSNNDYTTVRMRSDSALFKFDADYSAGPYFMSAFIEGDQNMDPVATNNRYFVLTDFLTYTPKADTSIVAEIGNYIPVKLKIKDELAQLYEFTNLYNSGNLKVKYKLWYDGWLSNDTISTTAVIDPNVEFKWYFSSDGADNTININHPDFKLKGDYQITAWLYEETAAGLSFIDKIDSEEFRLSPIVELTRMELYKSDYYSMDSIHVFEATCTDANWNDYPYMESMKFYYKKDGETSYTEIPEPPVKTTYYTRTWDSKAYTGEVLIKATASYYSDATYTELYETSDSITVRIFDGQTCVITLPRPAEEEPWDFEFAPYIYRGYYSDHSLESEATFMTTLKDVDDDIMIFDGTNWSAAYFALMTCPETKYHWGYLGYEWQWAYYVTTGHINEINGLDGWYNTFPFWDTLGPTKKDKTGICKKTLFFDHKRETDPDSESGSEESKYVSYYDKGYKAYVNDYEHLYPGIYNAAFHAYDINDGITDIAEPASVDFLIPEWKLKLLNESKWFDYEDSSTTGPTYVERTEYHTGDMIHSMIWRPFEYYKKNSLNYKITNSDTGAAIFEKDIIETDYLTDTFITDSAPEDTLAYYHHIWDTDDLAPGFYTIRAEGNSIIDNINVVQEREIQICPYYEQWENGGAWSEDWPAPEGQDALYWKINDLGYNYYAANQYMMEAHYETGFHLASTTTEGEYRVNDTYPAMLEICIAARQNWNRDGDFWYWEDQLSDFTVELSKDGADYVKVKTLDLQKDGYIDYTWNLPANPEQSNPNDTEDTQYHMTCAMNFYFPIGEVYGSGKSLKIKLGIEGIPEYFTDEAVDNKISHIYIDEIKLWYMKDREHRPVPRNLAAAQAKESNTLTLTYDPPAFTGSGYPEKYLIYREGKLIAETTSTSFTDTEIRGGTVYNYVVVAYYPGYDFYESSMLDCSIKYVTAPITYARPTGFTISKGIGLLDNCLTLSWLEPDPDVLYYEIYRNSVLLGTTTELSYHDDLLPDGAYEYYVKARYGEDPYEVSDATEIQSIGIYSTILPIYEDFEHEGELPLCWNNDVTPHDYNNTWASDLTTVNGISPYEGTYCSYVRGLSPYNCLCYVRSGLRTPDIDLSSYSNLNLSYMVNVSQDKYNKDTVTALNATLFNNSELDTSYCSIDHVYYAHPKYYGLSFTNITNQTNGVWQSVSVPVNYNFESCYILFKTSCYIQGDTTYIAPEDAAVMLDAVSLTGTIDLGTPDNVTIVRDSTNTTLSWDFVPGATEYKVYVSEDPYGSFTLDTTGTWISDTVWQKADAGDKYFYYIVAASATKEIIGDNAKIKLKPDKLKH